MHNNIADLDRWLSLFGNKQKEQLSQQYQALRSRYSESQRFYHTWEHLEACINDLDKCQDHLERPIEVEIALWFHDVVYDPHASDNEAQSAALADAFLAQIDHSINASKIHELILLTKHPSKPQSNDQRYLLDIDLAILGSPRERYDEYTKQIRQEYAFVPLEAYVQGRSLLLQSFLDQDNLYWTSLFSECYELQARENIQWEIDALKAMM